LPRNLQALFSFSFFSLDIFASQFTGFVQL
jgi:hypothetical protein